MPSTRAKKKAYILTVDMGYGHQRAVYPLADIAEGEIITANNYPGIPKSDRRTWEGGRNIYEKISRLKHVPILGTIAFDIMDYTQRIEPFYPRRDLSKSTWQLREQYALIRRGWGRDLIERLNKNPLPIIGSFPTAVFFAEEHGYAGEIYCICTDTDVNRAWAPEKPRSRIKYLVPNRRSKSGRALRRRGRKYFHHRLSSAKRKFRKKFGNARTAAGSAISIRPIPEKYAHTLDISRQSTAI